MPPVPSLDAFQRGFAAALLGAPATVSDHALAAQPGFAVYRNTVMRACIDALAANYPTVSRLVGDEWFEGAARQFALRHLPGDGCLAVYGEGFAEFLEAFEPAAALPYLPGVARLDRAWSEAHVAADAPVLTAATLSALSPQALLGAVLVPHPAARWVCSPALPIFTIWSRDREGRALDDEIEWRGEGGLLTRPAAAVDWHALGPAAATFLRACSRGLAFEAAAEKAGAGGSAAAGPEAAGPEAAGSEAAEAATPLATWLPALVAAGAFTRLESP